METETTVTRAEQHFKERQRLRGLSPSGVTRGEKREFEDSRQALAAKRVQKKYAAKEKVNYKGRQAGERKVKKEGALDRAGEVRHAVWAEAHYGVNQKVVEKHEKVSQIVTKEGRLHMTNNY